MKLKLKGGAYVDPDSELQDKAHVLKSGENLYSAVLGNSDVLSFYELATLNLIHILDFQAR